MIALGILATLFMFARPAPKGEPLRFADQTVQDLANDQRLGGATYNAVTDDGVQVRVLAASVVPDSELNKVTLAVDLAARLTTPDGLIYDISSKSGRIDESSQRTTLSGEVLIETSSGYTITTDAAAISTDLTFLETLAPVVATGQLGTLTADRMEATNSPETGTNARLVFTGSVHLLYIPQVEPQAGKE